MHCLHKFFLFLSALNIRRYIPLLIAQPSKTHFLPFLLHLPSCITKSCVILRNQTYNSSTTCMKLMPRIHDFLIKDVAICMLSCYVSVLLPFKTTCILSLLFGPFSSLGFWYFILHIFLLCQLSLTRSELSIFSKLPVMLLSPYVHSILISNTDSKSFPFKALCSFV